MAKELEATFKDFEFESFNAIKAANQISEFIDETKRFWEEEDFADTELWRSFREELGNYTKNAFNRVSKIKLRELRRFFRKRGVWISQDERISIARTLADILNEGERTA